MRLFKSRLFFFVSLLFIFFILWFCQYLLSSEKQEIQNLRAFTKLYGYVKYFHPSDEASQIDWDKFAIYGIEKVKKAENRQELKTALEELFLTLAPTVQIYHSNEKPEESKLHPPEDTSGLKIVAWQHFGVGLGGGRSIYRSIRINRENIIAEGGSFGTITQGLDAVAHRGKGIRLRASVKAAVSGVGNQGQLWLRVDRENRRSGFFDNMADRPITSNEWKEYEIQGKVDGDAVNVVFGCFLKGIGQVWVDEFQLSVKNIKDEWVPVGTKNPGFEEEDKKHKPKDWFHASPGYDYQIIKEESYKGEKSLLIACKGRRFKGKLFEKHPEVGEVINKELDAGLFCQVPLALYSDENRTLGRSDEFSFEELATKLDAMDISKMTADNEYLRLADVVIAWNVFQHFYSYFDVVDVDWDKELTNTLKDALADTSEKDFFSTLKRLVAKIQDGHGGVYHEMQSKLAGLPFKMDWVEKQVVITASKDEDSFQKGDLLLTIDGVKAEKALINDEEYLSGSPQWKRFRSLAQFGYGDEGTIAKLKIKRGNEILEIKAERNFRERIVEAEKPNIEELENNIYYVNLDKAPMKEISERIDELAQAKGVIFDLRGYPNGNHQVICHLLQEKDTSVAWMRIPQFIYPDRENIVGYRESGWGLTTKKPRIQGKVVFMTDGRAISYAESFMSFIEHYKLGEIVGQPTAGTNGNVNVINLPGNFRVTWTGMRVVKHDGSQHHLVGILPTIPVKRTVKGVLEGRDEFLEKALEIINQ
jgi:C-terminal processing protease CtpA/Prc